MSRNAVPPLMAAHILSAAIGISLGERNAHNHHSER